ncbi:MAG: putative aminodeoxychorismate lyase [Firmicutes bacterium ADurb.Bin193]|nr:MAG: putative aminodeoxychorismate lyase [Firmicutes bacterium ADurb.Bin193]
MLTAIIVAVFFIKSVSEDILGGGKAGDTITIEIPQGATAGEIAKSLSQNKIIQYPLLFRLYTRLGGKSGSFQLGIHQLRSDMSYREIAKEICEISVPSSSVTVTIPEGSEIKDIASKTEAAFIQKGLSFDTAVFLSECEKGEFDYPFIKEIKRKENRLEGYLFPATYTFSKDATERDVITLMLEKFSEVFNEDRKARAKELGFTTDGLLTLASIIEREGASTAEFKTVSSVFHNRINKNMKLESCATVQYILGERKEILSNAETRIKSPYNTYLIFGLPVGPIASPGEAAIDAALYPDATDYLYFRLVNGKHVFSKTFREHQQAGDI